MPRVKVFCPFLSNCTPSQGIIITSGDICVAANAAWILFGSTDAARLMASASTMAAVNARAGVPSISLPNFLRYNLPTCDTWIFRDERSRDQCSRTMKWSESEPNASRKALDPKAAPIAIIPFGLKLYCLYVLANKIASAS